MPECDVIIIGSGPAGVHSAWPLVMAGKNVTMVDGGKRSMGDMSDAPRRNFEDVRRNDPNQWRWFLGNDLSGIPLSGLTGGLGGGQVSGNRSYVTSGTEALPITLQKAFVIQSLAEGGLGAAWGATCAYLKPEELAMMGMPADEMERHYETITRRIGVSGPGDRPGLQPVWKPDMHGSLLLEAARKKQKTLEKSGMNVIQPPTAVLTQDKDGRTATTYADMDYWADPGRSVYRPQYTLEELRKHANFSYLPGRIATDISEQSHEVRLTSKHMETGASESLTARTLILAAGTVNSARIVLRSLGLYDTPTTFVGKPHVFSACVHPRTLGRAGPKERLSLCQLLVLDEEQREGLIAGSAQLYGYRSLQLFRLLSSLPLAAPQAMKILALLSPSLVIADIRFPGLPLPINTLTLQKKNNGDSVHIAMDLHPEDSAARKRSLRRLHATMRLLGLLPVKTLWLPEASTTHYAGTIPVSDAPEGSLSADRNGKVRGFTNVYAADASLFRCLPPTPHTLTIMANANRIGERVLHSL